MLLVDNEILHFMKAGRHLNAPYYIIYDNQLTGIGFCQDILGVGGGVLVLVGDALGVVDDVLGMGKMAPIKKMPSKIGCCHVVTS